MSEGGNERSADLVKQAQEKPCEVPPGVYTEELEDPPGYEITVVPERSVRSGEDPRNVPGQRRLGDGWRGSDRDD